MGNEASSVATAIGQSETLGEEESSGGTGFCGDGVQSGAEECDDGNQDDADACTNACLLPKCGDGVLQSSNAELCEPGQVTERCWDQGAEWGGEVSCTEGCTMLSTETCFAWQESTPALAQRIELGIGDIEFDNAGNAMLLALARDSASNYEAYASRFDVGTGTWSALDPLIEDNSGPFFVQYPLALAVSPDGDSLAVIHVQRGNDHQLYAVRYDIDAGRWSNPALLGPGQRPSLDVDSMGNAVLLSHDLDYQLVFSRYSATTGAWTMPTRVAPDIEDLGVYGLHVDDAGNAVSLGTGASGSGTAWYFSTLDNDTGEWQSDQVSLLPSSGSASALMAGAGREGTVLFATSSYVGDVQRLDAYDYRPSAGRLNGPTNIASFSNSRLAIGNEGHGVIAFFDGITWSMRRFDPGTRQWIAPQPMPISDSIDALAIDGEGNLLVAVGNTSFGIKRGLRYDVGAGAWSSAVDLFVPQQGLFSGFAHVRMDPFGRAVFAVTEGPGGYGPSNSLYLRRLSE
jgi:cysteine-rich repeat protein